MKRVSQEAILVQPVEEINDRFFDGSENRTRRTIWFLIRISCDNDRLGSRQRHHVDERADQLRRAGNHLAKAVALIDNSDGWAMGLLDQIDDLSPDADFFNLKEDLTRNRDHWRADIVAPLEKLASDCQKASNILSRCGPRPKGAPPTKERNENIIGLHKIFCEATGYDAAPDQTKDFLRWLNLLLELIEAEPLSRPAIQKILSQSALEKT